MPTIENPTGVFAEVDPYFDAVRTTLRPAEATGWVSLSAISGALTVVAAAGAIFSLRNISANPLLVRRVGVGFIATTGFTAAQQLNWGLRVARAMTGSDTGGTAIALTGDNCKLRTTHNTLTSVDCRIATTTALGGGAKTLDTNYLGIVGAFAPAAGLGTLLAPSDRNLLAHDPGDHPLVLGPNEGLNIMNLTLMGAGGVGTFYVNLEMAEALSF